MREILEPGCVPIKCWTDGVQLEDEARAQLLNVARLPIVGPYIAVMPDVHWGNGATVGSVIPQRGAIIPAAVGVDIGCGMMAIQTDVKADELDGKLPRIREAIEASVPVGGPGAIGSWHTQGWWKEPERIVDIWDAELRGGYDTILALHPKLGFGDKNAKKPGYSHEQLGTLGTGNHFIEVCLDTENTVWIMLHSGSRGVGNRIGTYFIERAKEQAIKLNRTVDADAALAWLDDGTDEFNDYLYAVSWAQSFAKRNRAIMMDTVQMSLEKVLGGDIKRQAMAVNCHHNYVEQLPDGTYLTRKGAVSAREGELGIIPGSMGARSFIVRGKGHAESFESCSHGAGRSMSRGKARKTFTVADHEAATAGVECRKDADVLDETPGAYKDIQAVMDAQSDLVDIVATLKQVVCVKG